jgi:hypothetical protein
MGPTGNRPCGRLGARSHDFGVTIAQPISMTAPLIDAKL